MTLHAFIDNPPQHLIFEAEVDCGGDSAKHDQTGEEEREHHAAAALGAASVRRLHIAFKAQLAERPPSIL